MTKKRHFFKADRMRSKLIIYNMAVIFFVTLILTVVGNYFYAQSIQNHSFSNTAEMQNQVQKTVDLKIDSVERMLKMLEGSDEVQTYLTLREGDDPKARLNAECALRELLNSYAAVYPDCLNVLITGRENAYLSNDSYRILREPLANEEWYMQAVQAEGKPVVISNTIGRNIKSWKNYSSDSYISVAKAVKSFTHGGFIGVILIDLDIEQIKALMEDITLGQTGFIFIMDSQGHIVYSPENSIVYRIKPEWFGGDESGSIRCEIQNKNYNIIYNKSEYTTLTTIGVYDLSKTLEAVSRVRYVSYIIAGVILAFSIVWSVLFAASFTKPIFRLSELMKRAQTGDFSVRFDNHYKGEIKQLGDAFNSMVHRINTLIEMVYQEQKSKSETELKMLQEQIKPHFLYNTLDTIQWMAKKYQAQDIVDLVYALASFFRISLSRGKEYIKLREEITMVTSYLDIQKARYEDMFEYQVLCEEKLLDCKVVKLILQPLVENALYHGIKESDKEKGHIEICIRAENEDSLLITVTDDGAGMSEEKCRQLNGLLREQKRVGEPGAYGVLNVNDRIRISYGEEYGLHYSLRPDGGVAAEIRHKLVME